MTDRRFFTLSALATLLMLALAAAWPQGYGARSIWPFGHTPVYQTPAIQAALARETAAVKAAHPAPAPVSTGGLRPAQ